MKFFLKDRKTLVISTILVSFAVSAGYNYALNSNIERYFREVSFVSGIVEREYMSGISWVDYDNDQNVDLFLSGRNPALYKNEGGILRELDNSFFDLPNGSMAGIFNDYNNDGCKDLFAVTGVPHGEIETNYIYWGNCTGGFLKDRFAFGGAYFRYAQGASVADYNNDGYLDIYVVSYGLEESKDVYLHEANALYRNNRDGTFTDVTKEAGVIGYAIDCGIQDFWTAKNNRRIVGDYYKQSYQPVWFDYNDDNLPDLYITNDSGISPLYKNNGDGTFADVTKEAGLCFNGTGMGVDVGDYDNDGDLDIYMTNTGANFLWHNNGDGTFTERAAEAGIADHLSIGWGTVFFDYNNDGYLDLYVVNGSVLGQSVIEDGQEIGSTMKDKIYKNNGDGTFEDVSEVIGIEGDFPKEAMAMADYNNDGFWDIFVAGGLKFNIKKHRFYENLGNRNNWFAVELRGNESNKDGVGAKIKIKAGGKTQIRQVVSGSSFISQNDLRQIFGLGPIGKVEQMEIAWPSGKKTELFNLSVNQILIAEE